MTLDLKAVVRAVGGHVVEQRIPALTPVDGLAKIQDYVVAGNPEFTTLVTGTVDELGRRLREDRGSGEGELMQRAVFVSRADSIGLRGLLERHGMTAILGVGAGASGLHAEIAALLANDQAAADRLVTAGTQVLTQVARRGGAPAVIAELAHRIGGWAVLLDADGHLITSAGAGRLHIEDAVAVALGRPVRVRHHGLQTHQVGSDRDRSGYLVIASRSSATSRIRDLGSQAAALFDLLLQTRDPSITERLGREALLEILLAGGPPAVDLLARWEIREGSLTAFALGTRTRTVDLDRLIKRWLDELGSEHLFVSTSGLTQGFVPEALVDDLSERVTAPTPLTGGAVRLGLGLPAPVDGLRRSAVQARQALDAALEDRRPVVRYAELPTVGLVLDGLSGEAVGHLAGALDGLREPSGEHGALTETLRVFLSEHGAHRRSAAQLGIHRQTLVARLRRAETLTGLSMDRADDRAAAWLALRALGR
ncbi:helix-turn-helix domain-containing protein [Leucobacter weissii]|uniref:Helix-turn-helix domain-containing protein n=1 Tax=Leucobacter weissii TaxID=1983706 RepID=A0A939MJH5_9MICO|nr:helix-turn-helix domain-containing protein [Leucobacter weissii]MBO1901696.1 helix-turn-helix domain-containing protein [Leucobacter weissii]